MSFLYSGYLTFSTGYETTLDPITYLVANQSVVLLEFAGYSAEVVENETGSQIKLIVEGRYLAHIIEGCNAMSIIILFIAFVLAFAQTFKKTALFILLGAAVIYVANIIRIAILAIALIKYPAYQTILHGVIFPGMIYGMVFLLWMLWVKMIKNPV